MKIAITTTGVDLQSEVDTRFGRCQYLLLVDTDSMDFQAFPNPYLNEGRGVGIQTAQFIIQKDAEFVLTGNCGPNAYQVLSTAGVGIISGISGVASEAIERFKRGEMHPDDKSSVSSRWGDKPAGEIR